MARQALAAHVDAPDRLHDAAGTMGSAVQSVKQGASEALPALGNLVSRAVYKTSYAVAYGVVFPVMLVVRALPKDNAMVHGLVDGARAARESVAGWRDQTVEYEDDADESDEEETAEPEHAVDGKPSEGAAHRRRTSRRRTSRKPSRSSNKR
jgi:hypothetical protein